MQMVVTKKCDLWIWDLFVGEGTYTTHIRKTGGKLKKSKRTPIKEKCLFRSFSWKIPAALFSKRKAKGH